MTDIKTKRIEVLNQAIKLIPLYGWTEDVVIKLLNNNEIEAKVLFPDGVDQLADLFIEQNIEDLKLAITKFELPKMKIRERIKSIVMEGFRIFEKNKEAVRQLAGYYLAPTRIARGFQHLANIASEIWYLAGDNSTDFNYYTKRGLLMGVLSTSFLFWLSDKSTNIKDTEDFVSSRIEDVMKIQLVRKKVESWVPKVLQQN